MKKLYLCGKMSSIWNTLFIFLWAPVTEIKVICMRNICCKIAIIFVYKSVSAFIKLGLRSLAISQLLNCPKINPFPWLQSRIFLEQVNYSINADTLLFFDGLWRCMYKFQIISMATSVTGASYRLGFITNFYDCKIRFLILITISYSLFISVNYFAGFQWILH